MAVAADPNTPRQRLINESTEFHHCHPVRRDGYQCVNDSLALLVVSRALVQSYPVWTDEHGTNVEQLAAIAVAALAEQGLLLEPELEVEVEVEPDAIRAVDA